MTQQTNQRTAYSLLFTGAALVWIWEFAIAKFGGHNPLVWMLIALGAVLILTSYFILYSQYKR